MSAFKIFIFVIFLFPIDALAQQCLKEGIFLYSMPDCVDGEYHLVFEDNFDGNSLDENKWKPYIGVPRDFEFEKQKAWHSDDNLTVKNGTLTITAKREANPIIGTWVYDWSTNPVTERTSTFQYSSGEIWTRDTFFYGKYEIRCRLPKGMGFWPAFWTFGGQKWNEIDFFEIYGGSFDRFTCNVHHDYNSDGESESCRYAQKMDVDFSDWHVFTCYYDFDKITWQIDGKTVRVFHRFKSLSGSPILCGEEISPGIYFQELSFPREPMHIIMNLAIQHGKNAPDEHTVFPNYYEIDYVRYFRKKGQIPCETCSQKKIRDFKIYPNPSIGQFKISFTSDEPTNFSIVITNIYGQEVLRKEVSSPSQKDVLTDIDLLNLAIGLYNVRITSGLEVLDQKIVIVR